MSQHAFDSCWHRRERHVLRRRHRRDLYGSTATNFAVAVKLVRTLMIIPICLGLAAWAGHRLKTGNGFPPAGLPKQDRLPGPG